MPVFIAQQMTLPPPDDTVSDTHLMIVLADDETDAREAFGKVVGPSLQMSVEELPPDQVDAIRSQLQPKVVQPYKPTRP
ncbi:hypothetical protein MKK69_04885 [Methylobacterium sp. J-026]|uniref:hypothetical protein n=1 Tax=Methylobacterium sp. J-026 TaxID=2836624 RepID=UPI001FB97C6D|nr:hypothetical protein [Methylobacterium sp. J-026]MCJ2133403.1 hypothetical protein [Methylobacterium sp. J-026]